MKEQTLAIPIDKIKADFQLFLTPEHNRRIIFSGPFGIGKTYFLNEFFKEKEDEYFSIFLRPVNYSLLSNEDIFKLLKYDILVQIIKDENFKFEEEFDFTKTEYLKYFLKENRFLILKNLLKALPKIRNVVSAAEELEKLYSKYKEGLNKINSSKELEMLKTFQQDSESSFLLEYDEVSEYISSKLDELANSKIEGKSKLQKVLIIDDLDRLDPEHIFRLFNVFSAHFDQVHYYENSNGNDNKFGFDKIIFVCDIENIRKIFHHKYGEGTDFSGYIDKFYSKEIFFLFHKDIFEQVIKPHFENRFSFFSEQNRLVETNELLVILLDLLFEGGELSIRELKRLESYKPSFLSDSKIINYIPVMFTKFGAKENSVLKQYRFLILIKLFLEIFGGEEIFYTKINRAYLKYSIKDDKGTSYLYNKNIEDLILFAYAEEHKFDYSKRGQENPKEFIIEENGNLKLVYKIIGGYYSNYYEEGEMWFRAEINGLNKIKFTSGVFYNILINAVNKIIKKGIIR
jgi:hypothetical protein